MRPLFNYFRISKNSEFEIDSYSDLKDGKNEDLRWLDESELYEVAESVPESIIDYNFARFVHNGDFSAGHFAEVLENADQVWEKYRELDEHSPRNISVSEALGYSSGEVGPNFTTNAPKHSENVEKEVRNYTIETLERFKGLYSSAIVNQITQELLGPEELAQAELILRDETSAYKR